MATSDPDACASDESAGAAVNSPHRTYFEGWFANGYVGFESCGIASPDTNQDRGWPEALSGRTAEPQRASRSTSRLADRERRILIDTWRVLVAWAERPGRAVSAGVLGENPRRDPSMPSPLVRTIIEPTHQRAQEAGAQRTRHGRRRRQKVAMLTSDSFVNSPDLGKFRAMEAARATLTARFTRPAPRQEARGRETAGALRTFASYLVESGPVFQDLATRMDPNAPLIAASAIAPGAGGRAGFSMPP